MFKKRWRSSIETLGIVSTLLSLLCLLLILHALTPSPRPAYPLTPNFSRVINITDLLSNSSLGPFGNQMLHFARHDLPLTIFIPTPSSFHSFMQEIGGISNSTSGNVTSMDHLDERDLAVVSRIFGFSTAPLRIPSSMIPLDEVLEVDSLSGFRLTIVRSPSKGILTVNNIACRTVDIASDSVIIHLIDGVLMDSEFEGSVMPVRDGEDEIGM